MKKTRKPKARVIAAKRIKKKPAAKPMPAKRAKSRTLKKVISRKTPAKKILPRQIPESAPVLRSDSAVVTHKPESRIYEVHSVSAEQSLPFSYNKTKLVLMIRDPYSIFCYWDFSGETWNWTQSILASHNGDCRVVLRVLEVTGVEYNGSNALSSYDVDVVLDARNWYVHVNKPESEWIFELGLIDPNGKFYLIVRGNRVRTPRDGPSNVIDEEWMAVDFDEIYALSGGFGAGLSSGEISKLIKERHLLQKALFSSFSRNVNPLNPQKVTPT